MNVPFSRAKRALAIALIIGAGSGAVVSAAPATAATPAMDYIVEENTHPGAARIATEYGITLGNGSGSILLAECAAGSGQIEVETVQHDLPLCFRVTGNGWLKMQISGAFGVGAGNGELAATSTQGGQTTTIVVPANQRRGVGAVDGQSTLLELEVNSYSGPSRSAQPSDTPTGQNGYAAKITTGKGSCSAALISPRWVLTTASCFSSSTANYASLTTGTPTTPSRVWFGLATSKPPANTGYSIAQVVPYKGTNGRDLALVLLAKPVTGITPISLPTAAPVAGAIATFTGWGRNATEWLPPVGKTQGLTVTSVGSGVLGTQANVGALGFCDGDAGAPIVSGTTLLGIAAQSAEAGCLWSTSTDRSGTASRVDDIVPWIYSIIIANP